MTGGSGFTGSHIVDRLVAVGYSLRVLDAGKNHHLWQWKQKRNFVFAKDVAEVSVK